MPRRGGSAHAVGPRCRLGPVHRGEQQLHRLVHRPRRAADRAVRQDRRAQPRRDRGGDGPPAPRCRKRHVGEPADRLPRRTPGGARQHVARRLPRGRLQRDGRRIEGKRDTHRGSLRTLGPDACGAAQRIGGVPGSTPSLVAGQALDQAERELPSDDHAAHAALRRLRTALEALARHRSQLRPDPLGLLLGQHPLGRRASRGRSTSTTAPTTGTSRISRMRCGTSSTIARAGSMLANPLLSSFVRGYRSARALEETDLGRLPTLHADEQSAVLRLAADHRGGRPGGCGT